MQILLCCINTGCFELQISQNIVKLHATKKLFGKSGHIFVSGPYEDGHVYVYALHHLHGNVQQNLVGFIPNYVATTK